MTEILNSKQTNFINKNNRTFISIIDNGKQKEYEVRDSDALMSIATLDMIISYLREFIIKGWNESLQQFKNNLDNAFAQLEEISMQHPNSIWCEEAKSYLEFEQNYIADENKYLKHTEKVKEKNNGIHS